MINEMFNALIIIILAALVCQHCISIIFDSLIKLQLRVENNMSPMMLRPQHYIGFIPNAWGCQKCKNNDLPYQVVLELSILTTFSTCGRLSTMSSKTYHEYLQLGQEG